MLQLSVKISRRRKVAVFSGRDTYKAREDIKQLGRARFLGATKEWEVSGFTLSRIDLESQFPGIDILEDGELSDEISQNETERVLPNLSPVSSTAQSAREENCSDLSTSVPKGLSVSDFLNVGRAALRTAFPSSFCIFGIIRQVNRSSGGRIFLDLGDSGNGEDYIRCAIWAGSESLCKPLEERGFSLEADLEVMLEVSANLVSKGGYLSLTIKRIVVEYTIAKLAAQREKTNEQLKKEGLFTKNKQLQLPFLPRRLGILTSSGGTVIHDFMASLDAAKFGFELFWYKTAVQGAEAKGSLLKGLSALSAIPNLDAILIFRGGGSQADLAVFNDYEIAKAVSLAAVPVLSAIGHQEDECSVQDVSYRGGGVPKDLGRYFADIITDLRARFLRALEMLAFQGSRLEIETQDGLRRVTDVLTGSTFHFLNGRSVGLNGVLVTLPRLAESALGNGKSHFIRTAGPLSVLATRQQQQNDTRLARAGEQIGSKAEQLIARRSTITQQVVAKIAHGLETKVATGRHLLLEKRRLVSEAERIITTRSGWISSFEQILPSLGPEAQLKRGFALLRKTPAAEGADTFIVSTKDLSKGEQLWVQLHDGEIKTRVE